MVEDLADEEASPRRGEAARRARREDATVLTWCQDRPWVAGRARRAADPHVVLRFELREDARARRRCGDLPDRREGLFSRSGGLFCRSWSFPRRSGSFPRRSGSFPRRPGASRASRTARAPAQVPDSTTKFAFHSGRPAGALAREARRPAERWSGTARQANLPRNSTPRPAREASRPAREASRAAREAPGPRGKQKPREFSWKGTFDGPLAPGRDPRRLRRRRPRTMRGAINARAGGRGDPRVEGRREADESRLPGWGDGSVVGGEV